MAVLEKLFARGFLTSSREKVRPEREAITCVGTNKTIRSLIPATIGGAAVVIELDKTYFPEDYVGYSFEVEVREVEAEEAVKADLKRLFSNLGIAYRPALAGKQTTTFFLLERDPAKLEDMKRHGTIYPSRPGP